MNHIVIDSTNCGSFFGPLASRYVASTKLRKRIDELFNAAQRSKNRYFVLEGEVCRAAQTTRKGAERYMTANTVLVEIDIVVSDPECIICQNEGLRDGKNHQHVYAGQE